MLVDADAIVTARLFLLSPDRVHGIPTRLIVGVASATSGTLA